MKCPIKPLGDRVVLLPVDEGEQQYGSIIVPDMGKEKPEMGEILAVGEGRVTNDGMIIKNQLKEGQIVMVPKFGAQTVVVEGETYIIASENDVLGIINSKNNE
tara:strand:- start:109 stop:417 length:309 start_codon:yes stop_codon:yes gene_type:complete